MNACAVELLAPGGWTDNGDGTYTTQGAVGFNAGGRVVEMKGPSLTYDATKRSFSGALDQLPWPNFSFLAGSLLGNNVSPIVKVEVMKGADVKALVKPREAPLPPEREVLAFVLNLDTPTFTLPGGLATLGRDEVNLVGFYFDPCDPLAFFSMAEDLFPPGIPLKVYSAAGSLTQSLALEPRVALWSGETEFGKPTLNVPPARGGFYTAGEFTLDSFGIPLALDGSLLVDVDPDRNGALIPTSLSSLLTGKIVNTDPKRALDFAALGNGSLEPSFPLLGELVAFLSDNQLSLSLVNGAAYLDRSSGGLASFRGTSRRNPLESSLISRFFTPALTYDVMGYVRSERDWGLHYDTQARFFASMSAVQAGFTLIVDENPELAIHAELDLGSVPIAPDFSVQLGKLPMRLSVDLTTGTTCGQTGYQGADFACLIGVCVGEKGFDFYPSCSLPKGYPCVDDEMCSSNSCTGFIPAKSCETGCAGVQATCEGGCEATRSACSGSCAATESTCVGSCTAATATCDAGCDGTQATCSGACNATKAVCTGTCNGTEQTCQTGCSTARTACNGACSATQSTCEGACGVTGNACRAPCNAAEASCNTGCQTTRTACNGTCDATYNTCNAGCSAGTGVCDATYETCRAGCISGCVNPCSVVGRSCWTCDRSACINSCARTRDNCKNSITAPCREACANTRNNCRAGCTNALSNCSSSCTSTGNNCRAPCNTTESNCRATCQSTGATCLGGCNGTFNNCGSACTGAGSSCRAGCDSTASDCGAACSEATTDCRSSCQATQVACVTPCQNAADTCNAACEDGLNDCTGPCAEGFAGCVDGCERVGTCD
jgi:hypothetical protein